MELSTDEQTLLFVGIGYLIAMAIWALSLMARARTLLRLLGEIIEPEIWQAIGAPASLKEARNDPEKRWFRFINSGEYLRQCDDVAIALIDDYRRRTKFMLAVFAVSGVLLLVRFWPLLAPEFLR